MDGLFVTIESSGDVSTIWLDRPDKHNALNTEMLTQLTAAVSAPPVGCRLIILRGRGKSFCAGADLEYMKSMASYSHKENLADSRELANLFYTILNCAIPVLCVAHGNIYGGGVGLVAACDIIMAAEDAKFCLSEVKLGLAPAVISPIVAARMGFSSARRYFLTGEVFNGRQALAMGLVQSAFSSDDQRDDHVAHFTMVLTSAAPKAQAAIKSMTNDLFLLDEKGKIQQGLVELIAKLRAGEEGQEGLTAFFEKREPNWL